MLKKFTLQYSVFELNLNRNFNHGFVNKTCNIQINLWKIFWVECKESKRSDIEERITVACNKTQFLKKEAWSYKTVGNLPAFSALYAKVL